MTEPDTAATMTVVCARANHPVGYGACNCPDHRQGQHGTAHGYVLLFVTGVPGDGLDALRHRLREPVGADVWGEAWAEWYGGVFEPLVGIQGDGPADVNGPWPVDTALRSLGDNRAYATVNYVHLMGPTDA